MNIYLMAYARNNLGDDLFTRMLISKYPNVNFDIDIEDIKYSESLKNIKNITVNNRKRDFNNIDIEKYSAIVYIGGSIFMENRNGMQKLEELNKFIKNAKNKNVPFFYISSNFGPYITNKYLELAKDTFSYCEDVCFRDRYSYNLFRNITTARYAPDLILSYNISDNKVEMQKDTVGISVIDLKARDNIKDFESGYLEMLKNNIEDYQSFGKKVYLFSFCKYEGDEDTIDKVLNIVNNKENIEIVKYNGNIEAFLNIYSKMEYMLSTRFHSMILSARLKQKVLVLSYSDKIDNVIEDMKFPFEIRRFNKNLNKEKFKLSQFREVKDISIKEKQLEKINQLINRYN